MAKRTFQTKSDSAMPAKAFVTEEVAIAAIEKFIDSFRTNTLPKYSDPIWKAISQDLGGKWSPACVYTNVREDRRSILSRARVNQGIALDYVLIKGNLCKDHNQTDLKDDEDSNASDESYSEDKSECKVDANSEILELIITKPEWDKIRPPDTQEKKTLKKKVWTNVIANAFWVQHRMPCAFMFKNAHISSSPQASNFLTIKGYCSSVACGNKFHGTVVEDPGNDGFVMTVRTRDTRGSAHEVVKRPLNGERRQVEGKDIRAKGGSVWKKNQARQLLQPGDGQCPIIPKNNVTRKVKEEMVDKELGVEPEDKRDLIKTIEEMMFTVPFVGLIHAVGAKPFYVFYSIPAQLHSYREYSRVKRGSTCIAVDSTGSIVKKLKVTGGMKSGHIFLYSIVINFEGTTLSVHHMLSEKHDTEFIEYWLKQWMRKGAPKPNEAVCDYSRALLAALCLAFNNNHTIKGYIDVCFEWASKSSLTKDRLASGIHTLIRVDVAHLMHFVSRWECLKKLRHKVVREFYLRCVAIMVDCQTLEEFERVFLLTCTVALHEYEDDELDLWIASTPKQARKELECYMADRNVKIDSKPETEDDMLLDELNEVYSSQSTVNDAPIRKWILELISKAKVIKHEGEEPSSFFLEEFIDRFQKLAFEFPLWSAAAIPYAVSRASSSYVEGSFSDLKTRTLKDFVTPMRVDKFLKVHALDILGANADFNSKLVTYNLNEDAANNRPSTEASSAATSITIKPMPVGETVTRPNTVTRRVQDNERYQPKEIVDPDDSDLRSKENWRGKAENVDDFDGYPHNGDSLAQEFEDSSLPVVAIASSTLNDSYAGDISLALVDHTYSINSTETSLASNTVDEKKSWQPMEDYSECSGNTAESLDFRQQHPEANDTLTIGVYSKSQKRNNEKSEKLVDSECPTFGDQIGKPRVYVNKHKTRKNEGEENVGDFMQSNKNVVVTLGTLVDHNKQSLVAQNTVSKKSSGVYFKSFPEIQQRNLLTAKTRKSVLLPNSGMVKMDGKSYYVYNACAFDSIVHILMTGALDDPRYASIIADSPNTTLQFVTKLINQGLTQETLRERLAIFKSVYEVKVAVATAMRDLSYVIDAANGIFNTWKFLMESEPSVFKTVSCSSLCEDITSAEAILVVNHRVIKKNGFSSLQDALSFIPTIFNVKCKTKGCIGPTTIHHKANFHVFIELDIRYSETKGVVECGMKCHLDDFPTFLNLNVKYRLCGVIGLSGNHFIAYCRRSTGQWQIHNDLQPKIASCSPKVVIIPHAAIYIVESGEH